MDLRFYVEEKFMFKFSFTSRIFSFKLDKLSDLFLSLDCFSAMYSGLAGRGSLAASALTTNIGAGGFLSEVLSEEGSLSNNFSGVTLLFFFRSSDLLLQRTKCRVSLSEFSNTWAS